MSGVFAFGERVSVYCSHTDYFYWLLAGSLMKYLENELIIWNSSECKVYQYNRRDPGVLSSKRAYRTTG